MIKICEFYDIEIFINSKDTKPYFYAMYYNDSICIDISSEMIINGSIPNKQLMMVLTWLDLVEDELLNSWYEMKSGASPSRVPSLSLIK